MLSINVVFIKSLFVVLLAIVSSKDLFGQARQVKIFQVNTFEYVGNEALKGKEEICEDFSVILRQNTINLGDQWDLKIERSRFDTTLNAMIYEVIDQAAESSICEILIGVNKAGRDYAVLYPCQETSYECIILSYRDYVSNYSFWRVSRRIEQSGELLNPNKK